MLKTMTAAIATAVVLTWAMPGEAVAQSQGARQAKGKKVAVVQRRPASVGQNGLCQRDTGTPDDKLNFRNRCDVEEFWRRIMDRASESSR
jgi:hypothetical protein